MSLWGKIETENKDNLCGTIVCWTELLLLTQDLSVRFCVQQIVSCCFSTLCQPRSALYSMTSDCVVFNTITFRQSFASAWLLYGVGQKSKLWYFFHIFTKSWPIFTIFSPVDSGRNLLLNGMHTTPIMSLHYLVKYKYLKTSSGKFLNYLSKMLNISYNKCQKDLGVATE